MRKIRNMFDALHFMVVLLCIQAATSLNEGDQCVVEHTNSQGVCTPANKCQSARDDFENNGIRPTFCAHTFNAILLCCANNSQEFDSKKSANNSLRLSERKCAEYEANETKTVTFITLQTVETITLSVPKCKYDGLELLVRGQTAYQGEFPHMAAIGWVDVLDNYVFLCGGSLISSRFVLSAAHCTSTPNRQLRDPQPQIVRLGEQNLNPTVDDGANPIDVPIKAIHKHPGYTSPRKYNDIALFELNSDVDFGADIRPACLWTKPDFPGYSKAVATGWGVVDPRHPAEKAEELTKVPLTLLDNDFCNTTLQPTSNHHWEGLSDGQLCAVNLRGEKVTCQGDSGSPLQVASRSNKCIFHIIGVTSFGRACAKSNTPAVYTRVSSYLDWIVGIVWPGE